MYWFCQSIFSLLYYNHFYYTIFNHFIIVLFVCNLIMSGHTIVFCPWLNINEMEVVFSIQYGLTNNTETYYNICLCQLITLAIVALKTVLIVFLILSSIISQILGIIGIWNNLSINNKRKMAIFLFTYHVVKEYFGWLLPPLETVMSCGADIWYPVHSSDLTPPDT